MAVLHHYESVGIVIVAFLLVVKERVGLESENLATNSLECGAFGIYGKRS